jgi:hypothetical protein
MIFIYERRHHMDTQNTAGKLRVNYISSFSSIIPLKNQELIQGFWSAIPRGGQLCPPL